jgi:osmoprotectant transport system permease protein
VTKAAAAVRRMTAPSPARSNPVSAGLAIVATVAGAMGGFVGQAPNRLVDATPIDLWQASGSTVTLAIVLLLALLIAAALGRWPRPLALGAALAGSAALLLLLLYAAGHAAALLMATATPAARTSLGPAFWAMTLCAALAMVDAVQRLAPPAAIRVALVIAMVCTVALMALLGAFDALSLVREYAARRAAFAAALGRHCSLVGAALSITLIIGLPLGILAARRPREKALLFGTLNILQTIPSVALFGLLITPLSALAAWSPTFASLGLQGIGVAPALIALSLYALLPIVRNTEAAITATDPRVVEAARGMGFTAMQILWRVELPLGLPLLLAGLRIVLVQTIGLAVVAALIGAGGLGTLVFQGIGQYATDLVLLGALPAIALALAADFAMREIVAALRRRETT